jgi:hypothetical protein
MGNDRSINRLAATCRNSHRNGKAATVISSQTTMLHIIPHEILRNVLGSSINEIGFFSLFLARHERGENTRLAFPDIELDVSCSTYRIEFMFSPTHWQNKSMFERHTARVRGEKRHNIGKRRAFFEFFKFHTRLAWLSKAPD